MKPLLLLPIPENSEQCRSIIVKCNKYKTVATVWADQQVTFAGNEEFTLDVLKEILNVCKHFTLFYTNLEKRHHESELNPILNLNS